MKDKRGLMKFLRYVLQEEEDQSSTVPDDSQISLQAALTTRFKISESLQAPLQALALSPLPASLTRFDTALTRIRRHMRSMGYFGPGFGAVVAKYGGNSELSQVACRAGAVGGSIYLLGHQLMGLTTIKDTTPTNTDTDKKDPGQETLIESVLPDGTRIKSRLVVGSSDDLPHVEGKPLLAILHLYGDPSASLPTPSSTFLTNRRQRPYTCCRNRLCRFGRGRCWKRARISPDSF